MERHTSESTRNENVTLTDGERQQPWRLWPLDDERQCVCGDLEADHRITGRCSNARCGCRGFEPAPVPEVQG